MKASRAHATSSATQARTAWGDLKADSIPASISGDRGTHGTTASKHLLSALVVQSLQHNE